MSTDANGAVKEVVHFNLTGFGKFQNVPHNPTTALMTHLPDFMKQCQLSDEVCIDGYTILETSGVGALQHFHQLNHGCDIKDQSKHRVWLHFGVNARSTSFALESQAFNEASFGCPDERGWQPSKESIVCDAAEILQSTLNIDELVSAMKEQGFNVIRSNDPGRFVCNWTYFNSLHRSCHERSTSLFVHVPPFSEISEEEQLKFILHLLPTLAKHIINNAHKKST